jgi:voltage-gated potassium channel Kch
MIINLIDSIFAIWSCVSFIWDSYLSDTIQSAVENASTIAGIEMVDFVVSLFFALNFMKDFILASSKRDFFFAPSTWIDIATTFPNIVVFIMSIGQLNTNGVDAAANISFLRFFRILKVLRLNRVARGAVKQKPGGLIQSQINELALTMLAALFIFAGAFQMIEQFFLSADVDNNRRNGKLDFVNALYFTVSTVATVGFGDVVPLSIPGKGLVVIMLCFIITVLSQKISTITTLMSKQSKYERMGYSFSAPHVIICGGIDTLHLSTFLRELFHRDHQKPGQQPIRAVVVALRDPDSDMLSVVTDPVFSDRITCINPSLTISPLSSIKHILFRYINGNLLDEDDMYRVNAHRAEALFIFCSQSNRTSQQRNDHEVLLQSMALCSFVQKTQSKMPRIIAMVHFSLTLRRFKAIVSKSDVNHQVICLEELKPALMVQGCINPGFSGLAYSMIRSFTLTDILGVKDQSLATMAPWQREFIDGMDYELYSTTLSASFRGISFAAAAATLYEKLQVFLIALEVDKETHLAPLSYTFPDSVSTVHVLAGSAQHALEVSMCQPPIDALREHDKNVSESNPQENSSAKLSMMGRLQSAAQKVMVQSTVTGAFRRRGAASDRMYDSENVAAHGGVASLKDMSSHWKKVRLAVKMGSAFGVKGSKALTKDSYQFLLQSDKNPKFSRMEAKKSFLILDEDVPLKYAKVAQYEGFGHIIYCCKSDSVPGALAGSLKRFIAPLRSKSCVFVHTPIVVLAVSMHVKDFEAVAMYPSVFVVVGNPLLMQDLRRAGIMSAKFAVVCGNFVTNVNESMSEKDDSTAADTAAMFAGNLMRKLNDAVCVVVELQYSRNIKFIGTTPNENHEIGVATASGRFFSVQYFHVLMCRCFYAPSCLSLLQEFLRPHPTFVSDPSREISYSTSIMTSVLVPRQFVGCTFGSMFSVCSSIGIVIAVYRTATVFNCARDKYLVCCPSFSMRLNHGDQLILLSPLPPKDVETAITGLSHFDAGMKLHQGVAAEKWRKVYDSVESESSNAASNSLSSEALLVQVSRKMSHFLLQPIFFLQLVDAAAKKIRELRHEIGNPDRSALSDSTRSPDPASPGIRGRASLDRQGSRRGAGKFSPTGEFGVLGAGMLPSKMQLR